MILSCPNCNTRYLIAAAQLVGQDGKKGRKVKCVKCQHVWYQEPNEQALKDEDPGRPKFQKNSNNNGKVPAVVKENRFKTFIKSYGGLSVSWKVCSLVSILVLVYLLITHFIPAL